MTLCSTIYVVTFVNFGLIILHFQTPQNPPCPTLFVANLGPSCTEQELVQIFSRLVIYCTLLGYVLILELVLSVYLIIPSRCPGFLKLKMQSTYGAPVAFVDFQVSRALPFLNIIFLLLIIFFLLQWFRIPPVQLEH